MGKLVLIVKLFEVLNIQQGKAETSNARGVYHRLEGGM